MYAPGHPQNHTQNHIYGPSRQQNLGQSARTYNSGPQEPHSSYRNGFDTVPRSSTSFTPQVAASAPPTSSTSMSFRYYQPPKPSQVETDSDDGSSEEEQSRRGARGKSASSSLQSRRGACSHCKGLKVKCHITPGQSSCTRCSQSNLQCVVSGRKKRRAVATHEELVIKSHKQDIEIRNLLQQLDEVGTEHRVQTWIAKSMHLKSGQSQSPRSDPAMLSSQSSSDFGRDTTRWASSSGYDYFAGSSSSRVLDGGIKYESGVGLHGMKSVSPSFLMNYFRCDLNLRHVSAPDIVTRGLIQPEHVAHLFRTYFDLINPYFSILDPALHTPDRLIWESHFLFTVICTLAAKYVPQYSAIATTLREFVRDAAGRALVQGKKTVDECQAFLLIAVYQAPQKKWEDQRGWLHMGIAFSLAHELKLNEPITLQDFLRSSNEHNMEIAERLWLNQTRTWLNCYCVDASHATQFGKPAMIAMDDYVARNCREWYRASKYNHAFDVHLVSYVEILRRMRRFRIDTDRLETEERENPKNPKKVKEMMDIAMSCHNDLIGLNTFWRQRFAGDPRRHQDLMCGYREETNRMNNAFNRLVVLFRGLQKAISVPSKDGGGLSRGDELVSLCVETAIEVITQMTEKLSLTNMLKYSMEAHFLFVTFAAAHLLSLMSPKMCILLHTDDVQRINHHIHALVDVLRSVADDRQANPYLYARYLSKQLKKFSPDTRSSTAESSSSYHYGGNKKSDGPLRLDISGEGSAAWLSTSSAPYSGIPSAGRSMSSPDSFQEIAGAPAAGTGDVDYLSLSGFNLDFSLSNFLQNLNQPTFTKSTPPPGEPGEWWQNMYPVSDSGALQATEWPLVMNGHIGNPADAQRVHYHMDVVR